MSAFAGGFFRTKVRAMRPSLLDPLFAPATALDGVGPRLAGLLANVVPADTGGREVRIGDLLFVLPHSVIDRRQRLRIADAPDGALVTLEVTVSRHQPPPRGRGPAPYRVFAHDDSDEIALTFFHAKGEWLQKALPEGERGWAMERAGRFLDLAGRIGAPMLVVCADTRADGMATRIPDAGAFEIIRRGATRIVQVTDEEVADAIRAYWTDTHNLVEGAGAAPLAALMQERERMRGRRVGVIVSGGNIDLALFHAWVLGTA